MNGSESFSGGCQCGAVRYRIDGGLRYPHLCHCRMCQKASGNYFMPLAASTRAKFEMTRGEASWFQSSDHVRRGFCGRCGTPLFYDMPDADFINITLGSLDEPELIKPRRNQISTAKCIGSVTLTACRSSRKLRRMKTGYWSTTGNTRIVTRPNGHPKESKT